MYECECEKVVRCAWSKQNLHTPHHSGILTHAHVRVPINTLRVDKHIQIILQWSDVNTRRVIRLINSKAHNVHSTANACNWLTAWPRTYVVIRLEPAFWRTSTLAALMGRVLAATSTV